MVFQVLSNPNRSVMSSGSNICLSPARLAAGGEHQPVAHRSGSPCFRLTPEEGTHPALVPHGQQSCPLPHLEFSTPGFLHAPRTASKYQSISFQFRPRQEKKKDQLRLWILCQEPALSTSSLRLFLQLLSRLQQMSVWMEQDDARGSAAPTEGSPRGGINSRFIAPTSLGCL